MNDLEVRQPAELQRHLDDCTDCRVLAQRATRLQRLLALKRYEQPPAGYHDNFLGEFHRRLAAVTQRPTLAECWVDWWSDVPVARLALVGAAAGLMVAGFVLTARQHAPSSPAVVALRQPAVTNLPAVTPAQLTVAVESQLVLAQPEKALVMVPPSARADERPSLDRLRITPVSFTSP
jgi:anti-sigma-K factor RskA